MSDHDTTSPNSQPDEISSETTNSMGTLRCQLRRKPTKKKATIKTLSVEIEQLRRENVDLSADLRKARISRQDVEEQLAVQEEATTKTAKELRIERRYAEDLETEAVELREEIEEELEQRQNDEEKIQDLKDKIKRQRMTLQSNHVSMDKNELTIKIQHEHLVRLKGVLAGEQLHAKNVREAVVEFMDSCDREFKRQIREIKQRDAVIIKLQSKLRASEATIKQFNRLHKTSRDVHGIEQEGNGKEYAEGYADGYADARSDAESEEGQWWLFDTIRIVRGVLLSDTQVETILIWGNWKIQAGWEIRPPDWNESSLESNRDEFWIIKHDARMNRETKVNHRGRFDLYYK